MTSLVYILYLMANVLRLGTIALNFYTPLFSAWKSKGHMANGYCSPGYFTFHAEGASSSVTDTLHWLKGESVGPGYDLKERTESESYADIISVGISRADADIIKKGAGKKFHEADAFVKNYKNNIKLITTAQKIALFTMIWKRYYVPTAKRIYNHLPSKVYERDIKCLQKTNSTLAWQKASCDDLDHRIIDVIVDFVYQGVYRFMEIKLASTKNDAEYFALCIENHPMASIYDKGRKRIPYLKTVINGPSNY